MGKRQKNKEIEIISTPEEVDMADDWYQYATINHFWMKARFRSLFFYDWIPLLQNGTILEIGCGSGTVIKQFDENTNLRIDGCDLNMFALEKVESESGELFCLNIYDKPSKLLNKYNGIMLLDVIEHIEDDIDFLRNSLDYLKEDGIVILNVPANQNLFSEYDIVAGHKRRYNKNMICELFNSCNLEIVDISYWGLSLLPLAVIRKLYLKFIPSKDIISNGFKPPNKALNTSLDWLMRIEHQLIGSTAIGTSVVAVGRIKN